jgi:hypothetical protein
VCDVTNLVHFVFILFLIHLLFVPYMFAIVKNRDEFDILLLPYFTTSGAGVLKPKNWRPKTV